MSATSSDEGEIFESGAVRTTSTATSTTNGVSVDRTSRPRNAADHPSQYGYDGERSSDSPEEYPSHHTYSRDGHQDRHRYAHDPNRLSVDHDYRAGGEAMKRRYDDHYSNSRQKRQRTRSRSSDRRGGSRGSGREYGGRGDRGFGQKWQHQRGHSDSYYRQSDGANRGGSERASSTKHSVSNRTHVPVATGDLVQEAKSGSQGASSASINVNAVTEDIKLSNDTFEEEPVIDEVALIEQRRKRREAIAAKYKTPLQVQALTLEANNSERSSPSAGQSPKPAADMSGTSQCPQALCDIVQKTKKSTVSPFTDLANKAELVNAVDQDGPSAADYDPTNDMEQDKVRDAQHQHHNHQSQKDVEDGTATPIPQDPTVPDRARKEPKEFDMFAEEDEDEGEEDDMFAEGKTRAKLDAGNGDSALQAKKLDSSMLDNWDDPDGYYKIILGELIDNGRYHVQANLGKGMFSSVVKAIDTQTKQAKAIKLIRNNDSMRKSAYKEMQILEKLSEADPEDKKHIMRVERHFDHKGHLCMVFECLSANLREVLKKFGRDVGINLRAIRSYSQQMFLALSLLRKCNIVHADLKPDNILVNESRTGLKVCDLGSATDIADNEVTSYLVSRYYRAPELMLGMRYDYAIDMWSIGCTLFELYTGKILFTGRDNNQMLKAIMECRGKISSKVLRKGEYAARHFDDMLNFLSVERDHLTGREVVRTMNFVKPTRDLKSRIMVAASGAHPEEMKEVTLFADLLDKCLATNPEKRIGPADALKHPFLMRVK